MSEIYDHAIIGMGPAGIGVAIALNHFSTINRTICFERGSEIDNKKCVALHNKHCCKSDFCHIISGVGGSATLSNGKISVFPAGSGLLQFFTDKIELENMMERVIAKLTKEIGLNKININDTDIIYAKDYFESCGVEYKHYTVYEFDGESHINYISSMMNELISSGIEVHADTNVVAIEENQDNHCYNIIANKNGILQYYNARKIIFSGGSNEAEIALFTDFYDMLNTSYEIGVRVEAKSECFGDNMNLHGDLKLKYKEGRTYCASKGGTVISYRTNGCSFLEGCTDIANCTQYSNLAVLIKVYEKSETDTLLSNYQRISKGIPIRQFYDDYLSNKPSNKSAYTTLSISKPGNINELLPTVINEKIKSFISHVFIDTMKMKKEDLILVAPEYKISRGFNLTAKFELRPNLYIIGAATGKFRGILQSLCSGIKCGEYISGR